MKATKWVLCTIFFTMAVLVCHTVFAQSPLASIPIDSKATFVHQEETVQVPGNGASGAVVNVTSRAFLSIDFAVQGGKQLTLLVLNSAQKAQMDAGRPITGRPEVRMNIDGVASETLTVQQGGYYVAILNSYPQAVSVTYRVQARAF